MINVNLGIMETQDKKVVLASLVNVTDTEVWARAATRRLGSANVGLGSTEWIVLNVKARDMFYKAVDVLVSQKFYYFFNWGIKTQNSN